MGNERRKHQRIDCAIPVTLQEGSRSRDLLTGNVSRHGAYLLTDTPSSQRQLIKLTFMIPGSEPVDLMAVVAHCTSVEQGTEAKPPGMGLEFFAMSSEAKTGWEAFITSLELDPTLAGRVSQVPAPAEDPAPVRRRHPRRVACFLVQVREQQDLRDFYTKDISLGGVFLRVPDPAAVRKYLQLIMIHPATQEEFHLTGEVVRMHAEGETEQWGVAIKFDQLPAAREAALLAFIESGQNHLEPVAKARQERIKQLAEVMEVVSENPAALTHVATELLATDVGDKLLRKIKQDLAIKSLRRALRVDPDYIEAHRALQQAYLANGDPDTADEHRRELERLAAREV